MKGSGQLIVILEQRAAVVDGNRIKAKPNRQSCTTVADMLRKLQASKTDAKLAREDTRLSWGYYG
jgi:hypothetical protein